MNKLQSDKSAKTSHEFTHIFYQLVGFSILFYFVYILQGVFKVSITDKSFWNFITDIGIFTRGNKTNPSPKRCIHIHHVN